MFVTTHSQDTIENFYYVANRDENKEIAERYGSSLDEQDRESFLGSERIRSFDAIISKYDEQIGNTSI